MSVVIYSIVYGYIFTAIANFFYPISKTISLGIIFVSLFLAFAHARFLPQETFVPRPARLALFPRIWAGCIIFLSAVWFLIVIFRPTLDTDANIYHLPLALLMNHSVWYPGIGKLSLVFSFPNGNSVLASVFTSFGIVGFENIPNLVIWILMGACIFIYLNEKGVNTPTAFLLVSLFLLTPVLLWQSYNMGTDLPSACFILLGLLALSDKKLYDAVLFFAIASIFKPLGMVALFMTGSYICVICLLKKEKINIFHPKIIIAITLFAAYLVRMFVSTGNPFYPVLSLKLAPWGIRASAQAEIMDTIKSYSLIERNVPGVFIFLKNFLFFPKRVNSSFWFWPFSFACAVVSFWVFIKYKRYKGIDGNLVFTLLLVALLCAAWFIGSPLFRFIAGVFMFMTIKMFVFLWQQRPAGAPKSAIYAALFGTMIFFVFNAGKHLKYDVLPLINPSPETIKRATLFDESILYTIVTKDGFAYSKASMRFCGRAVPPCIHNYATESDAVLIEEYRKYNRKFLAEK